MSRSRVLLAVTAGALSLGALTACGGDDEPSASPSATSASPSPSPSPTGLPKAEFVTQAEAVCKKANDTLEAAPAPQTPQELEGYLGSQLAVAKQATTDLNTLAGKQPDKAEIDRIFLTPLNGQLKAIEAYLPKVTAAAAQGEAALDALPDPELPKADTAAMKTYGFVSCVETASVD